MAELDIFSTRYLEDLDLEGLPPELQEIVADYPLNLIEVRRFEDFELFETDLQLVFGFLGKDSDGVELRTFIRSHAAEFANLQDDAYDVISVFSQSQNLLERKEKFRTEKGGVNMCKALEEIEALGEARGEARGISLGEIRGVELVIGSLIRTCKELGTTIEYAVQKIVKELSVSQNQAERYIEKYWI